MGQSSDRGAAQRVCPKAGRDNLASNKTHTAERARAHPFRSRQNVRTKPLEDRSDNDSSSSGLEELGERLALLKVGRPQPELKPEDIEPGVSVNSVVGRWLKEFPVDWQNKEHRDQVKVWRQKVQEAQRARLQEVRVNQQTLELR